MAKGLDCASPVSGHAARLAKDGYGFVARYYSYNAAKNLTRTEASEIGRAGLSIVSVWEAAGNHQGYFTAQQGATDGATAIQQAARCGQPTGSVIYFAVDYDASEEDLAGCVLSYAKAFHGAVRNEGYLVGVYGSGLTISKIVRAGYASYSWLSQSGGWAGRDIDQPYSIRQGDGTTVDGLNVDLDTSDGDGGGWKPS